MASTVLGVFPDKASAEDAIISLDAREYNPKEISIVMKDRAEAQEFADTTGTDVAAGATAGATTGALVGGLLGLLASAAIPGIGAFFIGGPIAAALGLTGAAATTASGAVTGAAAGGLIGALTSAFNLSDDDARVYERDINQGGILVAVPAKEGDEAEVKNIMNRYGADNVKMVEHNYASNQRRGYQDEQTATPAYFSEVRRKKDVEDLDDEE
jgi:hypothetical protein